MSFCIANNSILFYQLLKSCDFCASQVKFILIVELLIEKLTPKILILLTECKSVRSSMEHGNSVLFIFTYRFLTVESKMIE